jgi:hypothetical protein
MRYDVDFEAEPFQGYTDFDELEFLNEEAFEAGEFEWPNQELFETSGTINRSSSEYVRRLQRALNSALQLRLAVDGSIGVQTRSAIRSFQKRRGLPQSGFVDSRTEQLLFASEGGQNRGEGGGFKESGPPCQAAADDLDRLKNSLTFLNNALSRTPPNARRIGLLKELVRMDVEAIISNLSNYISAGCCEPSLKTLEADVRALPWPAEPDVLLQRDKLIDAILKAQAATKKDTEHC